MSSSAGPRAGLKPARSLAPECGFLAGPAASRAYDRIPAAAQPPSGARLAQALLRFPMPALARPALDPEAAAKFRAAGEIAREARTLGAGLIQPGARLRDVMEAVEAHIRACGARPAFPAQTSRNEIAAHYCPSPHDLTEYRAGDVVKIDVGVEVDGYIADTAQTVHLGTGGVGDKLVAASKAALEAAIAVAGPGVLVRELSAAIERTIDAHGFRPVYNLTGHGLDRWKVHTAPQVPPTPDPHDATVLAPGMMVAVEPFATTGKGQVYEKGRAEVFMMHRNPRKLKGLDPGAWAVIAGMQGLPFARRTFEGRVPEQLVEATIARLTRIGCLIAFPPLVDPDPAVRISQHEHTLMVTENGVEAMTA